MIYEAQDPHLWFNLIKACPKNITNTTQVNNSIKLAQSAVG